MSAHLVLACSAVGQSVESSSPRSGPFSVSDYDGGNVFWVVDGRKHAYHGMRDAWVFNRAMEWLRPNDGRDGVVLCYSSRSPLPLTGRTGVSRWFCGKGAELADAGDDATRWTRTGKGGGWDHAMLPPLQFHVEQTPTAELIVTEADCPWRLLVGVKGRSGPPLFAGEWRSGPGKVTADLLDLYRKKGYRKHYAELHFAIAAREAPGSKRSSVTFRLRLLGGPVVIGSLPVTRTADRAGREGAPICALVLDANARPLAPDGMSVTAKIGDRPIRLATGRDGLWRAVARGLGVGDHVAAVAATLPGGRTLKSTIGVHVTDGRFLGYDEQRRLLTLDGKPIGPVSGSYRGGPMFGHIGTAHEALVQGHAQWEKVRGDRHEGQYFNHGGPRYGFHFWESLTPAELEADYAYLARCGWQLVHLCQGWWVWERLDAGGRIAPHGAEQLAEALAAARRHGLRLHVALSHYPLGRNSRPYAQYLEAGYRREDYRDVRTRFYRIFEGYLADFAALFADETAISSYTAAGEGDVDCGRTFVNAVCDFMAHRDRNHLFLCEPHANPRPYPRDVNYYRRDGWKPLLAGMRTYVIDGGPVEHIGVQFKLGAMGHVFLGEGVFWGFMNAPRAMDRYRRRVRAELYTGLVCRSPILLTWEERVVEDERVVLGRIRRLVDWSTPLRRPGLALRLGKDRDVLARYERALSRMPLEYFFLGADDSVPKGTRHVIDTQRPFAPPAFASVGGQIPDALKSDMPLALPPGWAATYASSEDGRTLLAYVRDTAPAPAGASAEHQTTEAGDYTYVDTTHVLPRGVSLDTWQVVCVRPGAIRLAIYRREGHELVRVGQSQMVSMTRVGMNRFSLKTPIAAKKGDMIGFRIPDRGTHIAAAPGGRMLYVEAVPPAARTPIRNWQTESKTARIAAYNARQAPAGRPQAAKSSGPAEIVLQNFPKGRLPLRVFDLARRQLTRQVTFEGQCKVRLPPLSTDVFLLVGGKAAGNAGDRVQPPAVHSGSAP